MLQVRSQGIFVAVQHADLTGAGINGAVVGNERLTGPNQTVSCTARVLPEKLRTQAGLDGHAAI
jgi:hypothetical protein